MQLYILVLLFFVGNVFGENNAVSTLIHEGIKNIAENLPFLLIKKESGEQLNNIRPVVNDTEEEKDNNTKLLSNVIYLGIFKILSIWWTWTCKYLKTMFPLLGTLHVFWGDHFFI